MGLCKEVRLQFAENAKLDLSIRSIYFVVLKENPVSDPSNQYIPSWVLCFILFLVSRVVCQKEKIESADYYKLFAFEFNDFDLTDDETILSSLRIMFELGFMNAVHAKLEVSSETLFFYRRCMYTDVECNNVRDDDINILEFLGILFHSKCRTARLAKGLETLNYFKSNTLALWFWYPSCFEFVSTDLHQFSLLTPLNYYFYTLIYNKVVHPFCLSIGLDLSEILLDVTNSRTEDHLP